MVFGIQMAIIFFLIIFQIFLRNEDSQTNSNPGPYFNSAPKDENSESNSGYKGEDENSGSDYADEYSDLRQDDSIYSENFSQKIERDMLNFFGYKNLEPVPYVNDFVFVNNRQDFDAYDGIQYFRKNWGKLDEAKEIIARKKKLASIWTALLMENTLKNFPAFYNLKDYLRIFLVKYQTCYRIKVKYVSSAGECLKSKDITVTLKEIDRIKHDPH